MKKVLLTIAMVALGFTANAQEITFGVKAGLNIANLSGDTPEGSSGRTSFHVGGAVEIEVSDKFSIQPELVYSAQGMKFEQEGVDLTMKLDYLNVPLMAKYYVAEGFSLEIGPQIGFNLSAKAKGEQGGVSATTDLEEISSIDFGANFGFGYKLDSGLNFGARYNLGLSNVIDSDNTNESSKNGVFQVSVGYNF